MNQTHRIASALALFSGISLGYAHSAHAGGLGEGPSIALSGERLTTFSHTSIHGDVDEDHSSVSLFARHAEEMPFQLPRLAVDGFLMPSLTLGGSLSFGSYSLDPGDVDVFTLQPRVGYVVPLGSIADFWLKGGLSYYSMDYGATDESGLGLSGAFDFVINLTRSFGISVGPSIDFGLIGERSTPAGDDDVKYTTLALNVGLVGWL
jgi:hypothetical protein